MFRLGDQNKTLNVYFVDDENDGVDISAATTKQLVLRKPDGTETTVTASFISGGTTGGLTYTVTSTDFFDVPGTWSVQGKVTGTGFVWYTAIGQFQVLGNI